MSGLLQWINEPENKFFAIHVTFVFIISVLAEYFISGWTIFLYPALLVATVVSFLFNYPTSAIKEHGLFSEYLIDLRLLWLVMTSVFIEYVVYQVLEKTTITLLGAAALLVGVLIIFYARSYLQEKIVAARGFK